MQAGIFFKVDSFQACLQTDTAKTSLAKTVNKSQIKTTFIRPVSGRGAEEKHSRIMLGFTMKRITNSNKTVIE